MPPEHGVVRARDQARPSFSRSILANGADTLPTKVGLYDRTRSGWPDVVFSATDNETSWAVAAGSAAPLPAWQTAITNYATSDGYQVSP